MRILVTNDDGIHSHGLDVCADIARTLSDDVWVVAPEHDQSGVAHSLSLNDPLRLREVAERRFAVRGTPTDCVIMGARHVLDGKQIDLVLSGVNRGRNVGEDVIYSGTVAGAMEGAVLGIPSIALSQAYKSSSGQPPFWDTSLRHGPDIVRRILNEGVRRDVLINVNFPDCRPEEVKGIAVSALGRRRQERLHIDERKDGRGNPYYWIAYTRQNAFKFEHGTDIAALEDNCIALTPLRIDITDEPATRAVMAKVAEICGGIDGLVNVAGGFTWSQGADSPAKLWEAALQSLLAQVHRDVPGERDALVAILRRQIGRAELEVVAHDALDVLDAGLGRSGAVDRARQSHPDRTRRVRAARPVRRPLRGDRADRRAQPGRHAPAGKSGAPTRAARRHRSRTGPAPPVETRRRVPSGSKTW